MFNYIFNRILQNINDMVLSPLSFSNNNDNNRSFQTNLFKDNNFEVFEIDLVTLNKNDNGGRLLLKNDCNISLYENRAKMVNNHNHKNNDIIYFEIIYTRKNLYSFLVYHTDSKQMAEEYYKYLHTALNNLNKSISAIKINAFENLKAIMECFRINPKWTSTHIAARLGFETHFKDSREIAVVEINIQVEQDRMTPLHLAINQNNANIVQTILLDLYPNLNLIDSKQYSVLHSAALSTHEIFCLVLYQPNMFDRILWRNHQGSTALHLACFAQNYSIVLEFLKFGLTVRMLLLPPPKTRLGSTTNNIENKLKKKDKNQHKRQTRYDRIVRFTKQDLCDIDFQDIGMAGSPLHWVKHRRLMDKLVSLYKFRLNIRNLNGDTPLHVMTKRNRLRCIIALLCSGAKVNVRNKFGNTPLHRAIKLNEITLAQTLIVFDANIDAINNRNESIRHLAASATQESIFSQQLLFLVSSLGAKRCSKDVANCTAGCSYDGDFEGRWSPVLFDFTHHLESLFQNIKNSAMFEEEMKNDPTNDHNDDDQQKKGVNMLTLDGGGIRGLIIVQVLMEFQKHLDRPVIDYFQWIAGTSTGALIAAYLVIKKTLPQIRNMYFQFKDKVFFGDRPYDAEPLESLIKEFVGPDLTMQDLKKKYGKNVIIPAVLFDRIPMKLHLFRSYESHYELLKMPDYDQGFTRQPSKDQLVWKACRASGAAPTYFKAFGPFIDGGLMANNPTLDALTEFVFYNDALSHIGRHIERQELQFVLSVGTGRQQTEESKAIDISAFSLNLMELNNQIRYIYQMINLFLYEICNTDNHVVNRAEAFCSAANILYFRINPQFNKLIELDETLDFKIVNVLWETKRFMYLKRFEVERLVQYLKKFTYFPEEQISSERNGNIEQK